MSLTNTPRSSQLHIGIFGKRNSGKSTLINGITGHTTALVSSAPGTTTDPVYKTMEIHGLGPCVLIDTAGFDDVGELGQMRVEKTKEAMLKTDIALIVCTSSDIEEELHWASLLKAQKTPYIMILNKVDLLNDIEDIKTIAKEIQKQSGEPVCIVSGKEKSGIKELIHAITRKLPEDYDAVSILGDMVGEGDVVLLVMPQDIQAPKGRLILPQVQTIRELLDKKSIVISCTADKLEKSLKALSHPPKLIITDSQVFRAVFEKKPKESMLTSFSVLFAGYKGDIEYYKESAKAVALLRPDSKVLIAEACTHAPLSEDIGRVKLPAMLRKKIGEDLTIDIVSGSDFPKDLTEYDLIIQCGACMFNRKYVINRIEQAKLQKVPMTNYGVVIAYLSDILDKINI